MMVVQGKSVVVTGGGTAIGRAIAMELASAGGSVAVVGRRIAPLEETVRLIGARGQSCRALVCDVTDARSVQSTFAHIVHCDILINNAGRFGAVGALWEVDAEEWWADVATNLRGPLLCIKAALPSMMARNAGIIVNLDGGGGANGINRGGSGYGSSKAGLARLTETLARELATVRSQVQVYGMFPGLVRSEMTENLVTTPERMRWQSFVSDSFEQGGDRPPTDCAVAIHNLLKIAGHELSGRIFDIGDDFGAIDKDRAKVFETDARVMRLKPLPKKEEL